VQIVNKQKTIYTNKKTHVNKASGDGKFRAEKNLLSAQSLPQAASLITDNRF